MNNTTENIFQSIDYIVEARMSQLTYDKTELCTIEKVYGDEKPNTYYVSNGSLKFDVKSLDDKKYLKDSKVYVTIPQGDYALEKFIAGQYSSETPYKAQYVTPESQMVKAQEFPNFLSKELILNKDSSFDETEKVFRALSELHSITFPRSGFGEYDHILVNMGITTSDMEVYSGVYNIHLILYNTNQNVEYLLTIPSTELYGNPYNYSAEYPVAYLLPIPQYAYTNNSDKELIEFNLYDIDRLQIALEVDSDFFTNRQDATITLETLSLSAGYEAKEFEENSTQIKLILDSPNTGKDSDYEYDANASKQLSFDFGIYQDDTLTIYNETNAPASLAQYSAYWCQYVKGYQKQEGSNDIGEKDIAESGTYWKTIASDPLTELDIYKYTYKPNSEWDEDQVKVVIRYEGELEDDQFRPYYVSNGLTFKNKELKPPQGTNSAVDNELELSLTLGDDGNYNIYGTDNRLISYAKKNQKTSVIINKYFDNTEWTGKEQVVWKIPKNATMLKIDTSWRTEENLKEYDNTDANYHILKGKGLREITYDFADIYSSTRIHNTIYCEVYREDKQKTYRGSINLTFGRTNTNGSNYALNIIPSNYGGLEKDKSISFTASLEDENGRKIDIPNPEMLEWSWYYGDDELAGIVKAVDETGKCKVERTEEWSYEAAIRAILKLTIKNWKIENGATINLTANYPIGIGGSSDYITGASRVMYDYAGRLASYDLTPYSFPNSKDKHTFILFNGKNEYEGGKPLSLDPTKGSYPSIDFKNVLKPLPNLPSEIKPCGIFFWNETAGWVSWIQPLLIEQDTYASALLNEWDGNLEINEDGNYILAQSIGAGIKETSSDGKSNVYTGVLMGKVDLQGKINYGLYGFKNGELRFKFDEQGRVRIGNKTTYIEFDPTISGDNNQLSINIKKGQIAGWIITEDYFTSAATSSYDLKLQSPFSAIETEDFSVFKCVNHEVLQFDLSVSGFLTLRSGLQLVDGDIVLGKDRASGGILSSKLLFLEDGDANIQLEFQNRRPALSWYDPITNTRGSIYLDELA